MLLAMNAGSLGWTGGVADLFSERVSSAVNQRLTRIADDISRDLRFAGDHGLLAGALLNARRKLVLLHRFALCEPFPKELSELLQTQVRRYAEQAQKSLEDTARADRSGQLSTLLRNNSLLRYAELAQDSLPLAKPAVTKDPGRGVVLPAGTPRRRTFLA